MKLSEVLNEIATAVATDPDVEQYCRQRYNKSISVYVHIDSKNAPSVTRAPWLGLSIQGYNRPIEQNINIVTFELETALVIVDENFEVSNEDKIITLNGFASAEELSDIVFAAIEKAVSVSPEQLQMTYTNEQGTNINIMDYPSWIAARVWTISKHV